MDCLKFWSARRIVIVVMTLHLVCSRYCGLACNRFVDNDLWMLWTAAREQVGLRRVLFAVTIRNEPFSEQVVPFVGRVSDVTSRSVSGWNHRRHNNAITGPDRQAVFQIPLLVAFIEEGFILP
jgi:hypothetical protein